MPQLSRSTTSSLSEINIVPFVDVMLVLLVIFMITAPILQSGIEVDFQTKTVKEFPNRAWSSRSTAPRIYVGDDAINIHKLGEKSALGNARSQGRTDLPAVRQDCPLRLFRAGNGHFTPIGIQNVSVVTEPLEDTPH